VSLVTCALGYSLQTEDLRAEEDVAEFLRCEFLRAHLIVFVASLAVDLDAYPRLTLFLIEHPFARLKRRPMSHVPVMTTVE